MKKTQPDTSCAAIVTNSVDALVISLAAISIGAIYSSTATDMGAQVSTAVRLRRIYPAHAIVCRVS